MGIRVLLVEDNEGDAALIRTFLSDTHDTAFSVDTVSRLGEAKALCSHNQYDVILLDLGLPDSWGMDTLSEALDIAEEVPIVVLTGSKSDSMGNEAVRLGAQDYLVKGEVSPDIIERSIMYSIERRKAQLEVQLALQTFADLVREIPTGLLTFQSDSSGDLLLMAFNPRAEEILMRPLGEDVGKDLANVSVQSEKCRQMLIRVLETGKAEVLKDGRFKLSDREIALDLRAFKIPGERVCLAIDDVSERVREEELRRRAYEQIEKNIVHFASLVDEIRNPNSVIICLAERLDGEASKGIVQQAERIEHIVNRLDEQWVASETVRNFLHRHAR